MLSQRSTGYRRRLVNDGRPPSTKRVLRMKECINTLLGWVLLWRISTNSVPFMWPGQKGRYRKCVCLLRLPEPLIICIHKCIGFCVCTLREHFESPWSEDRILLVSWMNTHTLKWDRTLTIVVKHCMSNFVTSLHLWW